MDRTLIEQRLLSDGRRIEATVAAVQPAGGREVELGLRFELDGRPYEVTHRQALSHAALAALRVGSRLSLRVDAGDPSVLVIV